MDEEGAALYRTDLNLQLTFTDKRNELDFLHHHYQAKIEDLLFERLGSLVGLAVLESTPRTSGGSMGFPKYRLMKDKGPF